MKKGTIIIVRYIIFWLIYLLGKFYSRILNRIKTVGKENIPKNEIFCLMAEHKTIADPLWIVLGMMSFRDILFNQRIIPVSVADSKNFFSGFFKKYFFKIVKCIPAKRNLKNVSLIENQVDEFKKVILEKKENMQIFFSGTRARDNKVGECKYGPASLILQIPDIAYIPVALDDGIYEIMPIKEGKIFTLPSIFHRAQVFFGPKINFSDILLQDISEEEKIELIKKRVRDSVLSLKPQHPNSQ